MLVGFFSSSSLIREQDYSNVKDIFFPYHLQTSSEAKQIIVE